MPESFWGFNTGLLILLFIVSLILLIALFFRFSPQSDSKEEGEWWRLEEEERLKPAPLEALTAFLEKMGRGGEKNSTTKPPSEAAEKSTVPARP